MKNIFIFLAACGLSSLFLLNSASGDDCLECHREQTPGAVRYWEQSAHAPAIGCAACHGEDHNQIEAGTAKVDSKVCGRCHDAALAQHESSRHGMGLHTGWGCTRNLKQRPENECRFCHEEGSTKPISEVECSRFLKQSSEMGQLGCNRCHEVESSCATCHTSHGTSLQIARDPAICSKCHMGPDHPQWEMWQTSQHGILFNSATPEFGVSCQTCHMPNGSHNVSIGLTMTPGTKPYAEDEQKIQRAKMVEICSACHSKKFTEQELANADAVRSQSRALVAEAKEIIWDLADRGLLDPMPADRPPHPLRGATLVTDGQMLYEDTSHIERLFFKMQKYSLAKTIKGAYHQNPAYTHWYGNAELKMDLVDIKAEARRLEKARLKQPSVESKGDERNETSRIEQELSNLKNKVDRGAISQEEYQKNKQRLLESFSGD